MKSQRMLFSGKYSVCPPIYATVNAVMCMKYQTVQEEGLTNEDRHHWQLLHKQVHDKRAIAACIHN